MKAKKKNRFAQVLARFLIAALLSLLLTALGFSSCKFVDYAQNFSDADMAAAKNVTQTVTQSSLLAYLQNFTSARSFFDAAQQAEIIRCRDYIIAQFKSLGYTDESIRLQPVRLEQLIVKDSQIDKEVLLKGPFTMDNILITKGWRKPRAASCFDRGALRFGGQLSGRKRQRFGLRRRA